MWNWFSLSGACIFIFLAVFFWRADTFNLDVVQFINFFCRPYSWFHIMSNSRTEKFPQMFSFRKFNLFWVNFCIRYRVWVKEDIFAYSYSIVQYHLLNSTLCLLNCVCTFVKIQSLRYVWVYFCTLYSAPLIYVPVFTPVLVY